MTLNKYIIVFITGVFISSFGWFPEYSKGARTGIVTKLSYKGLIFKSWEGSIIQSGLIEHEGSEGKSTTSPNIMSFSVTDLTIVNKLDNAISKGSPVKLRYKEWLIKPINIETHYIIVEVEEAYK